MLILLSKITKTLDYYWNKLATNLVWCLIDGDIRKLELHTIDNFIIHFFFLKNYYILNDLIWQDGFLIDFLQKKIIDKWIRKFLIYSAYLFNERVVFDYVVRFYIDLVIWPSYRINMYEFNNVSSTILVLVLLLLVVYLVIVLTYFGTYFL